jgi:hypothetical protein
MDNNLNQGYQPTVPPSANPRGGRSGGRGRMIAGLAAAGVLVGGAAFGAVTMLSGAPVAAAAGPSGQAAVLNSALTTAATPAATVRGATARQRNLRAALGRLRRLGGIDGQFTFETKTGPRTLAFERGTIASVAGGDVVVRAKDGTTWSWTLVSESVVRQNGSKTTTGALSAGELVFVGGPVVSGTRDARLVVIRTPKKHSSSEAPRAAPRAQPPASRACPRPLDQSPKKSEPRLEPSPASPHLGPQPSGRRPRGPTPEPLTSSPEPRLVRPLPAARLFMHARNEKSPAGGELRRCPRAPRIRLRGRPWKTRAVLVTSVRLPVPHIAKINCGKSWRR